LGTKFLADNPKDVALPQLKTAAARDAMAWAAQPVTAKDLPAKAGEAGPSMQEMLAETSRRFGAARRLLEAIVKEFPEEKAIVQEAQWAVAESHLTQARAVAAFSATLARGQYVRASEELLAVAGRFHDHPQADSIPQMLSAIADELAGRGYHEEAVAVWTNLKIHYPLSSYSQQAAQRIAGTYQVNLQRPLLAAEAYLELNFERGGNDSTSQEAIYQIGVQLRGQKRWVEALHVLEAFVDSFPRHANTGQALAMVGQIHQANEAWPEAIAAYRRVIDEFPTGAWVRDAQWAIAECTINLSRWKEASEAYQTYLRVNSGDERAAEAARRLGLLKDLARYQGLVDEKEQRKAFDAQFQIAEILLAKLSNPVKAIIEYKKVPERWPGSYLAADAMFRVGTTYLSMGETAKARAALQEMAKRYPTSPLAGSAMYMVGQSFETEAGALMQATRTGALAKAQEKAQKEAYGRFSQRRSQLNEQVLERVQQFKAEGQSAMAEMEVARGAAQGSQYSTNLAGVMAEQASLETETLTASQLADRQDKYNAALRKAVEAYEKASQVPSADKADQALLRMAVIYAEQLKDDEKAMKTYLEIVRQFSGNAVAEDASWRIAQYYERKGQYADAIKAYESFLKNYRRSAHAGAAQFAVAENYEQLNEWVKAMDGYTNYINNFPDGPMVTKAREQINWIKTYRL
jgi:TolA-binding protein